MHLICRWCQRCVAIRCWSLSPHYCFYESVCVAICCIFRKWVCMFATKWGWRNESSNSTKSCSYNITRVFRVMLRNMQSWGLLFEWLVASSLRWNELEWSDSCIWQCCRALRLLLSLFEFRKSERRLSQIQKWNGGEYNLGADFIHAAFARLADPVCWICLFILKMESERWDNCTPVINRRHR